MTALFHLLEGRSICDCACVPYGRRRKRLVHPNLKARAYLLAMTFQANQTYASVSNKEILMRKSA